MANIMISYKRKTATQTKVLVGDRFVCNNVTRGFKILWNILQMAVQVPH